MPISDRDYMKFTDEERRLIYGGSPPREPRAQWVPDDSEPSDGSSTPVTDFYRESALSLKVEHPVFIIIISVVLGLAGLWLRGDEVVRQLVSSL